METADPSEQAAAVLAALPISNDFSELPPAFYTRQQPTPLPSPYLVATSAGAAKLVGIEPAHMESQAFIDAFTGNSVLPGSVPLAAVYSGHQFGVWAGQLGDGRAILLGELPAAIEDPPRKLELQLKGAGRTPYSRMGDGRAVLRSSIREFLCSEAMAALGIPTTRALCVTGSDARVMRETPETTAVATRMAASFVRFGSFEHWYYNHRHEELRILADHVIDRCYPALRNEPRPYQALLAEVTRRTARLIAQWQAVGFMHGVMNTDNMSVLGITLDYGPFGFMEAFDAGHICNHTDSQGRYAYHQQPQVGLWNCHALGQAMLPLVGEVDDVHEALAAYKPAYTETLDRLLHQKLGLESVEENDSKLFDALFAILQSSHVDFTRFFRQLGDLALDDPQSDQALRDLFIDRAAFDGWALQYRSRLRLENSIDAARCERMNRVNPKYVLRNYLAQQAIDLAQKKDFSGIARLLAVLEHPYDEQPGNEHYADLPPDWAAHLEVSCSS
ncbi:MAG: YdiU family protein [Paucimonas sp.]|nr:YdiU family protein [Paucimonas sp.]